MKNMKKAAKNGKALIVVITLGIITFIALAASIYLLSQNTTIAQLFGGSDNVYESARLERVTINGYKIGGTLTDEIKSYHAQDADFDYYYDNVAFWSNKEGEIAGLGFYSFNTPEGEKVTDINDSDIRYEGRRLATLDDFEEAFGIGKYAKEDESETVVYQQGNYEMTIRYDEEGIKSVTLIEQK